MRLPTQREAVTLACVIALLAGLCVPVAPARSGTGDGPALADATPQEVVSAVVMKLVGFVEWPASSGTGFSVCVYDSGPVAALLESYQGRPAREAVVLVRRVPLVAAVAGCHVAFVGGEGSRRLEAVAEAYRGRPVLVVAEGDDAIDRGAMVGLSVSGGRVVFDVDRTAASREQLEVSSKLLRLARRVR